MTTDSRLSPGGSAKHVGALLLKKLLACLSRLARYLGPLLLAALAYLTRLAMDVILQARLLLLVRQRRREPQHVAAHDAVERRLRQTRMARWQPWLQLPLGRRIAIQVAAIALLATMLMTARELRRADLPVTDDALSTTELQQGNSDGAESGRPGEQRIGGEMTPEPDPLVAVRRFKDGMAAATPGRWLFMDEPGLLPRGARTAWDGWGVGSPAVIEEADGRLRMWFRGCSFATGEFACAIGHAVSTNGLDWTKSVEPVIVPGDSVERGALNAIAVVRTADRYYLWYSVDEDWSAGRPRPVLYLATSVDGFAWDHAGAALEPDSADTLSIDHAALHDGSKFHLWFVDGGDLVHRTSSDGKQWAIEGGTPVGDIYDHFYRGSLSVFRSAAGAFEGICEKRQGYELVRVVSDDGNVWRVVDTQPHKMHPWPRTTATLVRRGELWVWLTVRPAKDERELISIAHMKRRP